MKVALIGASGFVGSHILQELLDRGHEVSAITRHPGKITTSHPSLTAVSADVFRGKELAALLKGHDAVISAYNPGWSNPDIYQQFLDGSQAIQQAVKEAGVQRYIVVGGAGSSFIAPGVQLIDTPEFPAEWKPGALAARDYLNILQKEKELDWTFVTPAIEMHQGTSGTRKGVYRTGKDAPVFDENKRSIISVEDLSVAIVDELEKPAHIKERFTVAW